MPLRGADLVARTLEAAGTRVVFSLSGNQIMPIYDACFEVGIEIVHVRHEAAAVHMADAWGRLTGRPGVALVTAGPGHANAMGAAYSALAAESPTVILSGHAPAAMAGRGAFQEIAQASMAAPVTKAAWTATDAEGLGQDTARALRLATGGRPGPVSLSLPADLVETKVKASPPEHGSWEPRTPLLDMGLVEAVLARARRASRPVIFGGPSLLRGAGAEALAALGEATGIPAVASESPRGLNDPTLGAIAEVLPEADLIVLLGRRLDFGLRFGDAPALARGCEIVHVDAEPEALAGTRRTLDRTDRLSAALVADPTAFARAMVRTGGGGAGGDEWRARVMEAVAWRPAEWASLRSGVEGPVHPLEVARAVDDLVAKDPSTVVILDGGEFSQWVQALVGAETRLTNGPAGSIGSGLPMALGARLARPEAPVVAVMGDGTAGFHLMEMDTAVRHRTPFVAIVGNDARWNAEYQIQVREYGEDRTHGCTLLPTRYDEVARVLGARGEHVSRASELAPALGRCQDSGMPALVDVAIDGVAAPSLRRKGGGPTTSTHG